MSEIVNWLAWGNGEPCPFCGKPFEQADVQHLFTGEKRSCIHHIGCGCYNRTGRGDYVAPAHCPKKCSWFKPRPDGEKR